MAFNRYYGDTKRIGLPGQDHYMRGVDAVRNFLKGWDDTGQLDRDIEEAIEEGII